MIKPIELKGMVRSTSSQNNADGNCEEIINMRLDYVFVENEETATFEW